MKGSDTKRGMPHRHDELLLTLPNKPAIYKGYTTLHIIISIYNTAYNNITTFSKQSNFNVNSLISTLNNQIKKINHPGNSVFKYTYSFPFSLIADFIITNLHITECTKSRHSSIFNISMQ